MVTGQELRRIALSFPHAEEKPHFERTSFRVHAPKGKIFASMPADEESANLMLSREEQSILCASEPTIFSPIPNKWGEKGATTMVLANADEVTLRSALQMSWKRAASEKLWLLLE